MNFKDTVTRTSRPVVVFGASITGRIVLDLMALLDLRPICFCDNDVQKQQNSFHGYDVISFERLCAAYSDALIVIAAGRYFEEIREQLLGAGFKDLFSDSDIVDAIDFRQVPESGLQKSIWHLAKLGRLPEIREVPSGSLHIPRLNVVVTSRCTLRCRHCSSLMPRYKSPSDFDTTRILNSLDRIFDCADLIYHVELLGGELFLNHDLPVIARCLIESGKVLHMDAITNGTMLPADSVLESLRDERVSVVIDDYGALSKKMTPLSDALKRLDMDFRVNRHWAWADLGGFEPRNRPETRLKALFSSCNFNSCTELLDGRLYRCPRSSHGTMTGLVPEYPEDFVDVSNVSLSNETLKKRLGAFFNRKRWLKACDHCNGNTSNSLTLIPAEQDGRC